MNGMNRLHLTLIVIGVLIVLPPLWFHATGRACVVGMVNTAERIALKSVNVADPGTGDGIKPEHWAYAWQDGKTLEQMTRVIFVNIGTPEAPTQRWIAINPIDAERDTWNPMTRQWVTRAEAMTW